MWAVQTMVNLYEYFIEAIARDKRFLNQNWDCCVKYYEEIYKDIEANITNEILSEHYNEVMRNAYAGNKLFSIIPAFGIHQFLDYLRNDKEGKFLEPLKK